MAHGCLEVLQIASSSLHIDRTMSNWQSITISSEDVTVWEESVALLIIIKLGSMKPAVLQLSALSDNPKAYPAAHDTQC